jgi:hypothetical protein
VTLTEHSRAEGAGLMRSRANYGGAWDPRLNRTEVTRELAQRVASPTLAP